MTNNKEQNLEKISRDKDIDDIYRLLNIQVRNFVPNNHLHLGAIDKQHRSMPASNLKN